MTTREFQQKKPLSILFTYFKPHRGLFILDLVCATVVALIDLAFPLVTRKSMYDLLPNQQYRTFFIVMGVMILASVLIAFIQEYRSQKASLDLKELIENILNDYEYTEDIKLKLINYVGIDALIKK